MNPTIHQQVLDEVLRAFREGAKLDVTPDDVTVPEPTRGDFALTAFRFTKHADLPPLVFVNVTAVAINGWLKSNSLTFVDRVETTGPYLNVFLKRQAVAKAVLQALHEQRSNYGRSQKKNERVVLEYVSPNTNKPLHLGHLRNATLGWSVAELLDYAGYEVIKTTIINDRGIHIMKPMLAYQKWSEAWDGKKLVHETPASTKMKSDAFVGRYYVLFEQRAKEDKHLIEEAQEMLRRWETNDKDIRALWKKLNIWVMKGHLETYEQFGVSFDKLYYESEIYEDGKKIVAEQLAKGLVQKMPDGATTIDLSEEGLGQKILLRSDGTSVYITQDLALVQHRLADYHPEQMVYVVGQEQDHQFKTLFAVLKRFGMTEGITLKHLTYHLVFLPDGRMKSREGNIVDADDLLNELTTLAAEEITKRHKETLDNLVKHRAHAITLAAIKYFFLKVRAESDIHFDPKQSLQFTGNTGPYLLYTYARLSSVVRKAKESHVELPTSPVAPADSSLLEWQLAFSLARFPALIQHAAALYDPSLIADFTYNLAKTANDFYESAPVLKAEPATRDWRLSLLEATRLVLKSCLTIMGIEALEEM